MDLEVGGLSGVKVGKVSVMRLEPEVVAVAKRRRFSMSFKRRVVHAADGCKEPGEVGALLRREGLYSSHLCQWRKELAVLEETAVSAKKRGPNPDVTKAQSRRLLARQQQIARLGQQLGLAD